MLACSLGAPSLLAITAATLRILNMLTWRQALRGERKDGLTRTGLPTISLTRVHSKNSEDEKFIPARLSHLPPLVKLLCKISIVFFILSLGLASTGLLFGLGQDKWPLSAQHRHRTAQGGKPHQLSPTYRHRLLDGSAKSEEVQFTISRGSNGRTAKLAHFGRNYDVVKLSNRRIRKTHLVEKLDPSSFNLAVLRLPEGSRWPFVGVARAPLNHIEHNAVPDTDLDVQLNSLVGFGLQLTDQGTFRVISRARFLHIPTRPAFSCGASAIFQGPEDPRPYWSDDGRPMLVIGIPSTLGDGFCRGIGFISDLRTTWPELTAVLANVSWVKPFDIDDAEDEVSELTWIGAEGMEKNWMPFFPGPKANPQQKMPFMHYQSHPEQILEPPAHSTQRDKDVMSLHTYTERPSPVYDTSACLVRQHPHVFDKVHGATPLYRLTLCRRGTCVPSTKNTVLVSLHHYLMEADSKGKRAYTRFFSFWDTTDAMTPLGIGPMFQYNGPDNTNIVYALTMFFVPRTRNINVGSLFSWLWTGWQGWRSKQQHVRADADYGVSHGFLDDRLFVSMGVNDVEMATLELSVLGEMLSGVRACGEETLPNALRPWM